MAALTLGLSACSSDELATLEPIAPTPGADGGEGAGVNFSSSIVDALEVLPEEGEARPGTRTTIENGQFTAWTLGDDVTVTDGILSFAYEVANTSGTSCTFKVREGNKEFLTDATTDADVFYAFYPEKAVKGWNASTVTAQIFATQLYEENVNGGTFGAYMASEGASLTDGNVKFDFHLATSVIEVNLATLGVTPKAVSIKSNNGVSIAGVLKYNCAARTASVNNSDATDYAASTQSDVITLTNISAGATTVRFYLLPVQLTDGITITVLGEDGTYYTKTSATSVGNAATEGLTTLDGVAGATVCKPYYKRYNFGAASAATLKNDWMATIPGNTKFHMLSLPGAHNSATYECASASKCQSLDIAGQLAEGVRGFDFRPTYKKSSGEYTTATLPIYHGITETGVLFASAMDALVTYVKEHPTEAIVVLLQKEDNQLISNDVSASWRKSVREYLDGTYTDGEHGGEQKDYILKQAKANMPLSDCRGKVVVVSRNPYGSENVYNDFVYGARINGWPDNTVAENANLWYTWDSEFAKAYVQDAYKVSNDDKIGYVKDAFALSSSDVSSKWFFNCLNQAESTLSPNPANHAKVTNPATNEILPNYSGRLGFVFFDFCGSSDHGGDALLKNIIAHNAKYVCRGRTRVTGVGTGTGTGAGVAGDEYADDSEVYVRPEKF